MWKGYLVALSVGLFGGIRDMSAPDKSELLDSWTNGAIDANAGISVTTVTIAEHK